MAFSLVVAVDANAGIARDGLLPWAATPAGRADMKFFRALTLGNVVIMGRRTRETLSAPLLGRVSVIVTSTAPPPPPCLTDFAAIEVCIPSFAAAVEWSVRSAAALGKQVFVIGGRMIYEQALTHPYLRAVYVTRFKASFDCNEFLPCAKNMLGLLETRWPATHENVLHDCESYRISKYTIAESRAVAGPVSVDEAADAGVKP